MIERIYPHGISLCMIVKNEAARIGECLSGIASLVDQMIVVDTGSSDNTIELAQQSGAKVVSYEWHHDTAAARNFSLTHASYEWILVLDADETISPRDFPVIRNLITDPSYDGYIFFQRHYTNDPDTENWRINDGSYPEGQQYAGFFDVNVVRLFRNRPDIFYSDFAHELVEESIKDSPKKNTGIPIHHYGIAEGRVSKVEKSQHYLNLLLKDLEKNPDSFKTHYLLGRQYYQLNDNVSSIVHFKKALAIKDTDASAFHGLALALTKSGDAEGALEALVRAIQINPSYEEPYYTLAVANIQLLQFKDALDAMHLYLKLNPRGVKGLNLLGYIYLKQKLFNMAEKQFRAALALYPGYHTARGNLITTLLAKSDFSGARREADILIELDPEAQSWVDTLFPHS